MVVKPAGMVVHPAPGHHSGTLVNALLHHVGGSAIEVAEGEEDDVADGLDDEALGGGGASPSSTPCRLRRGTP